MRYVLGFAFDERREWVALIRKDRGPECNIGKLNGVGGKIKVGESLHDAMSREFAEETGVMLPPQEWAYRGTFRGEGWSVKVFRTFTDRMWQCRTVESEEVVLVKLDAVGEDTARNVQRLISLCLDNDVEEFMWRER